MLPSSSVPAIWRKKLRNISVPFDSWDPVRNSRIAWLKFHLPFPPPLLWPTHFLTYWPAFLCLILLKPLVKVTLLLEPFCCGEFFLSLPDKSLRSRSRNIMGMSVLGVFFHSCILVSSGLAAFFLYVLLYPNVCPCLPPSLHLPALPVTVSVYLLFPLVCCCILFTVFTVIE